MKIEIISGSARKAGLTKRVALHLKDELAKKTDVETGLIDMESHQLESIQRVFQSPLSAPVELKEVAERMFTADAFVLVTPEYNGSYSSALKNFIDHFPNLGRKVFAIAAASPGQLGGIRAALQLQAVIDGLQAIGSPRLLIVPDVHNRLDEFGNILDKSLHESVDAFIMEFLWLAQAIHKGKEVASLW